MAKCHWCDEPADHAQKHKGDTILVCDVCKGTYECEDCGNPTILHGKIEGVDCYCCNDNCAEYIRIAMVGKRS